VGLRVEPFDRKRHDRREFSSGEPSLDTYLARQAGQDARRDIASLFCLVENDDPRVIGFYTLCASSVPLNEIPTELAKGLPAYADLPAILLGRLAVHVDRRGHGLGELLLFDAFARSVSNPLAAWCVVVDALNESAAGWYARYGLQSLPHEPLRMIVPMKTIRRLTPGR
jgi:GNAT superfamily N-acetyltransferase